MCKKMSNTCTTLTQRFHHYSIDTLSDNPGVANSSPVCFS